jgi:uncharacterized protein (DUF305 family)
MSARSLVLLLMFVAVITGLTACAGTAHDTGDHLGSDKAQSAVDKADSIIDGGGAIEADVMFAQMMIPHHEQAVQMADIALDPARGASPQVVELASRIKAAQDPEIAQMNAWLEAQGAAEMMDHSGHGGMGGMLSQEQLDALANATGAEFDRLFLEGMIAHHEGAIAMAEDVRADGGDPEIQALADAIIKAQRAEIAEMRGLLK